MLTSATICRAWAMPSADTFNIQPIAMFLGRHLRDCHTIVDPFARNSRWGTITNDLDPSTSAEHHMHAADFMAMLAGQGVQADAAIFDPPYSPRQISECYRAAGMLCGMEDTQNAGLYAACRRLLADIVKPGGIVLSFGWNSTGMGKAWPIVELLLVCHGAAHNDTICVAQVKPDSLFEEAST